MDLRTFTSLGVHIPEPSASGNSQGDCPFCGKEGHFFVDGETTLWDCKRCGEHGNGAVFLKRISEEAASNGVAGLFKLRGLPSKSFKRFGMGQWNGLWMLPVVAPQSDTVVDIRTWDEEHKIRGTAGLKTGLLNAGDLFDKKLNGKVFICEGEWDCIALWSLFDSLKLPHVAVGIPGANIFKANWVNWFNDRSVVLCYDADEAGDEGMERARKLLKSNTKSIEYLHWPNDVPTGFDLRDFVLEYKRNWKLIWKRFQKLVKSKPRVTLVESSSQEKGEERHSTGALVSPIQYRKGEPLCSWEKLRRAFGKWVEVDDDLDGALRISLATVLSTQLPGDPLWMYIVGPPGSGKTTCLTPLKDLDQCVFRSALTRQALVSGFQGKEDPSLLAILDQKTLVLKDATTILAAPYAEQEAIFSYLRDAYDGTFSRNFGNNVFRHYNHHFSIVAAVTNAIHGHSNATMGERFLKYQINLTTQEQREKVIRSALENYGEEERMQEELSKLFYKFLNREVSNEKVRPKVPKWATDRIVALAQLVSKLRAKVERNFKEDMILYRPVEEAGTRLGKQLLKLACMLVEVAGLKELDNRSYGIVERVAFDSCIGFNMDILEALLRDGKLSVGELAGKLGIPETNVQRKIEDLTLLKVITKVRVSNPGRYAAWNKYEPMEEVKQLWDSAKVGQEHFIRLVRNRKRKQSVRK